MLAVLRLAIHNAMKGAIRLLRTTYSPPSQRTPRTPQLSVAASLILEVSVRSGGLWGIPTVAFYIWISSEISESYRVLSTYSVLVPKP